MNFAYVLSPYTHQDKVVMDLRAHQVACGIAELMSRPEFREFTFFSPIVHYHQVAIRSEDLPRDVDFWFNINVPYMRISTHAVIFTMPGWEDSKGIAREVKWFKDNSQVETVFYNAKWGKF